MNDWDVFDAKEVEKTFLRLDDAYLPSDRECNIQIDIIDAGSWILKFRKFGLIYNNRDLILSDAVNIDATIVFDSTKAFRDLIKNSSSSTSIADSVNRGHVRVQGSEFAIEIFQRKILQYHNNPNQNTNGSTGSISVTKFYRMNYNGDLIQPLKHGWLNKKRDIFSGWRLRYIVVYPGRVEYYVNEHDRYPRDVISLLGAEVSPVKKCAVNGEPEHYYLIVEPKGLGTNKTLKLASSNSGIDAHAEALTWAKVFQIASKSSDPSSIHYTQSIERNSTYLTNGNHSLLPHLYSDSSSTSSTYLHPQTPIRGPLASARSLIRRTSRSFAMVGSGQEFDDPDFFNDGNGNDFLLTIVVVILVMGMLLALGWYLLGWNGVLIVFGFLGIISIIISIHLIGQIKFSSLSSTSMSTAPTTSVNIIKHEDIPMKSNISTTSNIFDVSNTIARPNTNELSSGPTSTTTSTTTSGSTIVSGLGLGSGSTSTITQKKDRLSFGRTSSTPLNSSISGSNSTNTSNTNNVRANTTAVSNLLMQRSSTVAVDHSHINSSGSDFNGVYKDIDTYSTTASVTSSTGHDRDRDKEAYSLPHNEAYKKSPSYVVRKFLPGGSLKERTHVDSSSSSASATAMTSATSVSNLGFDHRKVSPPVKLFSSENRKSPVTILNPIFTAGGNQNVNNQNGKGNVSPPTTTTVTTTATTVTTTGLQ